MSPMKVVVRKHLRRRRAEDAHWTDPDFGRDPPWMVLKIPATQKLASALEKARSMARTHTGFTALHDGVGFDCMDSKSVDRFVARMKALGVRNHVWLIALTDNSALTMSEALEKLPRMVPTYALVELEASPRVRTWGVGGYRDDQGRAYADLTMVAADWGEDAALEFARAESPLFSGQAPQRSVVKLDLASGKCFLYDVASGKQEPLG